MSSFGQNVDSLIRSIRSEYSLIVKNKEWYKKAVLYIDHREEVTYNEDGSIESVPEREIEEKITYYIDRNNQIRHISHYYAFSHHHYLKARLTNYYLKDNDLFFVFQQNKEMDHSSVYDNEGKYVEFEDRRTKATEKRIYTTGDIKFFSANNCVRYLFKSVEGEFSNINNLFRRTANVEVSCSDNGIFDFANDLIEIFYTQNKTDLFYKGSDVKISKEPTVAYSFYETLFGQ